VVAAGDTIAGVPTLINLLAVATFLLSIAGFGVLAFRGARSSDIGIGAAIWRSVCTAVKMLLELAPDSCGQPEA